MQTIYDTSVFVLILARTANESRLRNRGERSIAVILAQQGVIYYS